MAVFIEIRVADWVAMVFLDAITIQGLDSIEDGVSVKG